MDRRIEDSLEDYLRGSLDARKRAEFDLTLAASDEETRSTVERMQRQSLLIRETLRAPENAEPSAGFYARVMARIEAEKASGSIWAIFLEPIFFRRLALASATLLLLLGITVFTGDETPAMASYTAEMTPDEAMASPSEPLSGATFVSDPQAGRNALLVELTTYQE